MWSAADSVSDYTENTPYEFGSASSNKNFTQTAVMSFAKKTGFGDNKNESVYWLGWNTQVNARNLPVAGNIMQIWLSPRWVAADPTWYANYFCQS